MRFRGLRKCIALCILLGSILLMYGCGSELKESNTESHFSQFYSTESCIVPLSDIIMSGFVGDYYCCQTYTETSEYQNAYINSLNSGNTSLVMPVPVDSSGNVISPDNFLVFMNGEGKEVSRIDLNEKLGKSSSYRLLSFADESCWVLSQIVDLNSSEAYCNVDQVSPYSEIICHYTLEPVFIPGYVSGFFVDEEGKVFLTSYDVNEGGAFLLEFNKTGAMQKRYKLPQLIVLDIIKENGQLFMLGTNEECQPYLCEYSDKNSDWNVKQIPGTSPQYLYAFQDRLYGVNDDVIRVLSDDYAEEVSLKDFSVLGNIQNVSIRDDGSILILSSISNGEIAVLYRLKPTLNDTIGEKEEFVIAGYDLENTCVVQLVEYMSIIHPEKRFVMRDYKDEINTTEEENWSRAQKEIYEKMSLDIANGNEPDMYFDQYDDTGLGEFERLGYLKDLTPYIDKLDHEQYYVEKMTMGKEHPCILALAFDVLAFQASPQYVNETKLWTYDDFYHNASNFENLSFVQSFFSKEHLLKLGIQAQIADFVKDGKAYFTEDSFVNLLEWANNIGCKSNWDSYVPAELDEGIYMLDYKCVSSFTSVFQLRNDIILGFPNENGSLHACPYGVMCISESTSFPDLAWEVIQYSISEDFQSKNPSLKSHNSVNRRCCKESFEKCFSWLQESKPGELLYSKDEYWERYSQILIRADRYLHASQIIVDICLEEAGAYFASDYTAEHVAELIQNRVSIYLEETKSKNGENI